MNPSTTLSEVLIEETCESRERVEGSRAAHRRVVYAAYSAMLAASIALWFLPIRAALDTDETGSYWQIAAGFSRIWPRQLVSLEFPAYYYVLWLWTRLIGTSEMALRTLSVLAMLGSVYLLFRTARELFGRESAFLAAIIFCLEPAVFFASIDVRPYAFGVLAINSALFILLRLRQNDSNWLAALLGLSAACIVWFHFLLGAVVPALAAGLFVVKAGGRRTAWRQFAVATAVFTLALLPTVPALLYLFRTRASHVCEGAPNLARLVSALAPGWLLPIFLCVALAALLVSTFSARQHGPERSVDRWKILLCASLALIPALILYSVSVTTAMHVFTLRYRLAWAPGIALCWGLIFSRFRRQAVRMLGCISLLAVFGLVCVSSSDSWQHQVSWKNVLEAAEKNAATGNAPVLICSAFVESDFEAMPLESPKTSRLFAPLAYYPVSVPVVPVPRDFNAQTVKVASLFLERVTPKHERFLALEPFGSHRTLEWIEQTTSQTYTFRKLWDRDGFVLMEFLPRAAS